jgi:hypothetical protein
VYCTSFNTGDENAIIGTRSGPYNGYEFAVRTNGTPILYYTAGSSINPSTVLSLNTWYHLAVVRNGSNAYFYINGTLSLSSSSFTNGAAGGSTLIGYDQSDSLAHFYGYISNLRITNTIVYTGNFTPPTSHLTAVSGTQLLTLQNSTFIDNSSNNYTITNNNSVTTTSSIVPFAN